MGSKLSHQHRSTSHPVRSKTAHCKHFPCQQAHMQAGNRARMNSRKHASTHACTRIHTHMPMCVCAWLRMSAGIAAHRHPCMHTCIRTLGQLHMHPHIHMCTLRARLHARMHGYTPLQVTDPQLGTCNHLSCCMIVPSSMQHGPILLIHVGSWSAQCDPHVHVHVCKDTADCARQCARPGRYTVHAHAPTDGATCTWMYTRAHVCMQGARPHARMHPYVRAGKQFTCPHTCTDRLAHMHQQPHRCRCLCASARKHASTAPTQWR